MSLDSKSQSLKDILLQPEDSPNRREFLLRCAALASAGVTGTLLAAGCGGGGGSSSSGEKFDYIVKVSPSLFAATELYVNTLQDEKKPVHNGQAEVLAEAGVSNIFVTDEMNNPVAMALTFDSLKPGGETLTVDAESTLQTLINWTIGFHLTNTTLLNQRLAVFKTLPQFNSTLNALKAVQKAGPLGQGPLWETFETEFMALMKSYLDLDKAGRDIEVEPGEHRVSLAINDPKVSTPELTVSNGAWKFLKVDMRAVKSDDSTHSVSTLSPAILGVSPLEITSLFDSSAFQPNPSLFTDKLDFSQYSEVQISFQGIGFRTSLNEALPEGIVEGAGPEAILKTILLYIVSPIISFLTATKITTLGALNVIDDIYGEFMDVLDIFTSFNPDSPEKLAEAFKDIVVLAIKRLAAKFLEKGLIKTAIHLILGWYDKAASVVNLIFAARDFFTLPSAHFMTLSATGDGEIVIS